MTSPLPSVTPSTPLFRRYYAAWWDGSPETTADVLAAVSHVVAYAWSTSSNDNLTLLIQRCPPNLPTSPSCRTTGCALNQWLVIDTLTADTWTLTDATFQAALATSSTIVGAGSTPGITSVTLQEETGSIALPALLLGGSTSVTITMSGSFADLTWIPKRRAIAGASVLSTLTFTETARTVNSITYTVTAGVASIAGVLLVDGYKLTVA